LWRLIGNRDVTLSSSPVHAKLFTLAGTVENREVFWLALRVKNA